MSIRKMIALHPAAQGHVNQPLGDAVHHAMYCAKMCLSCADACMAEAAGRNVRILQWAQLEERVRRLAGALASLGVGRGDVVSGGGGVATVQVNEAGLASTFPPPSIARTRKVWLPSTRPV